MAHSYLKILILAALAAISTIFNPAMAIVQDTLSWSWEVTTTASTSTKSFIPEFKGTLKMEWGDGVSESFSDSLSGKSLTHTYTQAGNFSCKASGTALSYFKADSKRLLTLDPSKANSLTYLSCTSNQLSTVNLSASGELVSFYCSGNNLQLLNVAACTKLQTLTCSDNQLKSLDVSALPLLKKLTCHTNALTSLQVARGGALNYVSCTACSLQVDALHALFEQLPALATPPTSKNLLVLNNPGSTACSMLTATQKNWLPDKVSNNCVFYMGKASAQAGQEVEIPVALTNPLPVIAFELDVSLPSGFVLDTLQSRLDETRRGSHVLTISKTTFPGNVYKFMAYSLKPGDVFNKSSGTLLRIIGKTPDSVAVYPVRIQKSVLVDSATVEQPAFLQEAFLSVVPSSVNGDANSDGRVDISDVVALVAYINGRVPLDFDEQAADLDMNGTLNVTDVTRLVILISQSVYSSESQVAIPAEMENREDALSMKIDIRSKEINPSSLAISLKNPIAVQALQFDVRLPESMVPGNPALSVIRNKGHQIQMTQLENHRYRVLIYALRPDAFLEGDSGVVAVVPLVKVSGAEEGTGTVQLEHVVASDAQRRSLDLQQVKAEIQIKTTVPASSIRAGASEGKFWVAGSNLTSVSVWSVDGRLLHSEKPLSADYYEHRMPQGTYLLKIEAANQPTCTTKIGLFH